MKNSCLTLLLLLLFAENAISAGKADLRFHANGEFKIVQFTDTHINTANKSNLASFEVIKSVLSVEKPDLVVLTGDIVTQEDPSEGYQQLWKIFEASKVPWVVVFGNHESERGISRKQLSGLVEKIPGCLNSDVGGITGNSNFILPILDDSSKAVALIYCMDSNSYSTLKPNVDGYGWISFSQINWYRKNSAAFTEGNHGQALPAVAFFHIPLPEYTQAHNQKDGIFLGARNEDECSPVINSGLFTAMLECGDVMGTFVGHDHLNDYISVYHGIALTYGRVSKFMKDPEDPKAGGRVIVLKKDKREFETWIREFDGKKVYPCTFPTSFVHHP